MSRSVPSKIYAAPRRFDLASLMVATVAFSLLFGLLRLFSAYPIVYVCVTVLVISVGLAQALLFGGRYPRLASVTAGVIGANLLFIVPTMLWSRPFDALCLIYILCFLTGVLLGYAAGALVGGVFLVADVVRQGILRSRGDEDD